MLHNFIMIFENKVAQKTQTALVESNHGRNVGAAKLFWSPQDGTVASERNYKINFASWLFGPTILGV